MNYGGSDYDPAFDEARLDNQLGRIYSLMIDGRWKTLSEIAAATGDHEASISSQLRHLRKERFGGYIVNKRRRGDPGRGLWEYQLLEPVPKQLIQAELFGWRGVA